jgi:Glycoside-hydrolase family GH114
VVNRVVAFVVLAVICFAPSAAAAQSGSLRATGDSQYKPLPATDDSWYWEIDPPEAGLSGLPPTSAAYPAPGSARIWDTDLFNDSNTSSGSHLGIPTGPSKVVKAIHAAGHYGVCYVEAGAFQAGFPDDSDFAESDYGHRAKRYEMQGYSNEWWFDIAGFKNYVAGRPSRLAGAAVNIAAGLNDRFRWCALEGQDAVEPDDIDGYTNRSATGAKGGGWGLTRADSAGFERWLAYQAHEDGLAVLQKNDSANAKVDEPLFDGVLSEECNDYKDPCAGKGGDWDAYLSAGKPVLNAEYRQDGETASKFCRADDHWRIWGAGFSVDLNGPSTYDVCWNAQNQV